jgi:uncharacterized protein HemX
MMTWMDVEEDPFLKKGPAIIAGVGLGYILWSWHKFQKALQWETLPFVEVCNDKLGGAKRAQIEGITKYEQEELSSSVKSAGTAGKALAKLGEAGASLAAANT